MKGVIDPREFDAFYLEARQRVLRCVFLLTGDLAEAQDATQEAFVRAWQRWDGIGAYVDPEAWVRTVACRIAVGRWRGLMRRVAALRLLRAGSARVANEPSSERLDIVAAHHSAVIRYGPGLEADARTLRDHLVPDEILMQFDPARSGTEMELLLGTRFTQLVPRC